VRKDRLQADQAHPIGAGSQVDEKRGDQRVEGQLGVVVDEEDAERHGAREMRVEPLVDLVEARGELKQREDDRAGDQQLELPRLAQTAGETLLVRRFPGPGGQAGALSSRCLFRHGIHPSKSPRAPPRQTARGKAQAVRFQGREPMGEETKSTARNIPLWHSGSKSCTISPDRKQALQDLQ
jgi:hypothetical protein